MQFNNLSIDSWPSVVVDSISFVVLIIIDIFFG